MTRTILVAAVARPKIQTVDVFLVSDASFTHFLVKLSLEAPANFLSAAAMTTFYNAIAFLRL
jgi:hypothetical protein